LKANCTSSQHTTLKMPFTAAQHDRNAKTLQILKSQQCTSCCGLLLRANRKRTHTHTHTHTASRTAQAARLNEHARFCSCSVCACFRKSQNELLHRCKSADVRARKCTVNAQKEYDTWCSQAVSHPSTIQAQWCLTWQI